MQYDLDFVRACADEGARRSLGELPAPAQQRDAALDLHAQRRRELIAIADGVALELAERDGTVTSTRVAAEMRARGYGPQMAPHDPRWLGAVLLPSRGWVRADAVERSGSKARPVAVWRRA